MTNSPQPILILGANGFLGSNLTRALLDDAQPVRAFSRRFDRDEIEKLGDASLLEIHEASVCDQPALMKALDGVSTVVNLLTFSVPSSAPGNLQGEITTTFQANNLLLSAMIEAGVKRLVFPSSGGTIYGEIGGRAAREDDPAMPLNSHGLGKLICEEMIRFYKRVHGLDYLILRVSNAYGAARIRRVSQGVIDVFLEELRAGRPLNVWGSLDVVRDYIFIDDLIEVFLKLLRQDSLGSRILNVGSGKGTSLREVIDVMAEVTGLPPQLQFAEDKFAGISHNVLDTERLRALIDWSPRHDLRMGVRETWKRKRESRVIAAEI
ncbi:MAG TPA: NAD-dependent epimerase/dehydratase family protein [Blastocatellia bacterium]|nr:NAD-dependent epimerase/dehydratase family protein [Blastocatellia bacterium]